MRRLNIFSVFTFFKGVEGFIKLLGAVSHYATGFLLLFLWAEVVNEVGLVVPVLDGTLVKKLVYVPAWYFTYLYPVLAIASALTLGRWAILFSFSTFSVFLGSRAVAVVSSLVIVAFKVYREGLKTFSGVFGAIIFFELSTIAYYVSRAGRIEVPLLEYLAYWDLAIRLFLAPLSPLIVVIFSASGYILLAKALFFRGEDRGVGGLRPTYLVAGVLMALAVSYAIYSPLLNPGLRVVGVDTRVYYPRYIVNVSRYGLSYAVQRRERTLFVLMLYALNLFFGMKTTLMLLTPMALVLYTVASYVMARELMGDEVARYVALVTPLNYTVAVGVFSAYYNNLIATSMIFVATALLERWVRDHRLKHIAPAVLLLELATYTHSFMAMFYSMILGFYAVFRRGARIILLFLAIAIMLQSLPGVSFWVSKQSAVAISKAPLSFSENWWDGVYFVVYNCAAALAVNPLEWILAIVGVVGSNNLLLASWLTVGGSLSLFSSPQQWVLRWRSLYAIPLSLFQAKGLAILGERSRTGVYAMLAIQAAYMTVSLVGILGS